MRVTPSMVARTTLRDLNRSYARLGQTQGTLSSGKAINKPSDDPTGTANAMGLRQAMRRNEQYQRSLDDAKGWLSSADNALVSGIDRLERAKELIVRASNGGGLSDPNALPAMATELRAIRADLLALANSRYGERALFSGTVNGPAYDTSGTYVGNAGAVRRDVAPNTTMDINLTGTDVFGVQGVGAGDLFEVLDRVATAMTAGDQVALETEHANLTGAVERLSSATVEIGARSARVDQIEVRSTDDKLRLTSQLSEVEDVDIVSAMINVQSQQSAYQAALATAAKVVPMSLLNFLQ